MTKKQAAWLRVLIMIALIVVFIVITIRLCMHYGDAIFYMILGVLLIIPGLPIIVWAIIAAILLALLKLAIESLIKVYDPFNSLTSFF